MIALILASAMQAASSPPVRIPAQPELTRQIEAAEAGLFQLFFEGKCDPDRFRAMLADDIEFYHDKEGFNVRKPEEFVAMHERGCKSREDPTTWRSRRELVRSTLHVDPVPGHGAIETGDHLFYERHGATGEEKLAGKARFAMLWVLGQDGKWRLSRVLSYAHADAK